MNEVIIQFNITHVGIKIKNIEVTLVAMQEYIHI